MVLLQSFNDRGNAFFGSKLFESRFKTKIHICQIALVVVMFILTGARISLRPQGRPLTRSDTLGIVMGIKTLFVLAYQVTTSHVIRFQKWQNLRLYVILNFMEILFWFAVVILTLMSMSRFCQGAYCGLGFVVLIDSLFLVLFAFWTFVVSSKLRREAKVHAANSAVMKPIHEGV